MKDSFSNDQDKFSQFSPASRQMVSEATRDWAWLFVGGLLCVALGFWAAFTPYLATEGIVWALGWILLIGGGVSLIQSGRFSRFGGTGWRVFQSLLSIVGGVIMLRNPAIGALGVTVTICFYLFMSATAQFMMAQDMRPVTGTGWLFVSSIISYILGVLLLAGIPMIAFYVPGVFLAVDLICGGMTAIAVSMHLRKLHRQASTRHIPPTDTQVPRRAA